MLHFISQPRLQVCSAAHSFYIASGESKLKCSCLSPTHCTLSPAPLHLSPDTLYPVPSPQTHCTMSPDPSV